MPIRINLLAEAQAAEEMRRRDPVKRTLFGAAFVVGLVLLWSLTVQARIMRANSELRNQEAQWQAMEKRHTSVTGNLKKSAEIERKLAALNRLSANRFLLGSTLNALQQTVADQVHATRVKIEQGFTLIEAVPAKTNDTKTTAGKPAATIEKIAIRVEAKDGNPAEQNYNKFKESIAKFPAFQTIPLNGTNQLSLRLTSLSKPSFDPGDPTHPYVMFTLELQFPEVRRNE